MYYRIFACSTQRLLMRITVYQRTFICFLNCIVAFIFVSTVFGVVTVAQEEPTLIIDVFDSEDWNEEAGTIIFEGKTYDITVSTYDESVILGANLSILGTTYVTSLTEPYVTIDAPVFEETDSFVITASKEGYQTASLELAVLKGELFVVTDRTVVEEKQQFQVTVTDQNNEPVQGAFVYVTDDAAPISTDLQGKAVVSAPETDMFSSATIQVIKSGYLPGSTSIRIESVQGSFFELTEPQFLQILPILLAILVVILSIIYVLFRQKKNQHTPQQKQKEPLSDNPSQSQEKQRFQNKPARYPETEKRDLSVSTLEPRVEEIRIPVQAKKKETTYLSEENEQKEDPSEQKKQQDEWFKGQDYMRYKLDELTGKIDQKTDGKWFEGEHDTKNKVDEALKKNLKKKKIDEPTEK